MNNVDAQNNSPQSTVQFQIAKILAEAPTLNLAAPRFLQALCEGLNWDLSSIWELDSNAQVLRPLQVWHRPDDSTLREFAVMTCATTLEQGAGLPGRVWARREVVWVQDVRTDENFPRVAAAVRAGLASAFAFPLLAGGKFVGVLEAFTRQTLGPDPYSIDFGRTLATQLGFFLLRQASLNDQTRLAAIVRDSDDAIFAKDLDGILLDWNPAAERLYGYTRQEVIGKSVQIIFPPEYTGQLDSIMTRIRNGEKIEHFETVRVRKDGTRLDISVTISPLRNETGTIIGASVIARDVTESKRARAKLRESEEHLRAVFNSTTLGFATLTPDTRFAQVNDAFCRIVGYTRAELLQMDSAALTHPDDIAHTNALVSQLLTETVPSFVVEKRYFKKDGTIIWVQNNLSIVRDAHGKPQHLVAICQDITESKQTQDQVLTISRMPAEDPNPVMRLKPDGEILYANAPSIAMLEYWLREHGRVISQELQTKLHDAFSAGVKKQFEIQYEGRTLNCILAPIIDAGYVNFYGNDITELKRVEQALQTRARQQEALYQLADQLQRAKSLDDIFNAALDAIMDAVQCDRASILLYDDGGVMRFVSWRDLSDAYRRATEGHSPWTPDEKNPQPISMDDVAAADLEAHLRATIQAEGIGALAFIPLVADAKLIGKFMVYFNAPHVFSAEERELCLLIARQLAFAVARRRAQEQLWASENRVRLAVDSGAIGIWDMDLVNQTRSWSDQAKAIYGLAREETLTFERQLELIHPEDRDRVRDQVISFRDQGTLKQLDLEHRIVRPDGSMRWVAVRGEALYNGGPLPIRLIGTITDITERKHSEERFRLMIESMPNALLMVNRAGEIVLVNAQAETLFGYRRDELLDMTVENLVPERFRRQHNQDRSGFFDNPRVRKMGAGRDLYGLRRDGAEVPVEIGLNPLTTPDGEFVLISVIDISDRKQMERQLTESEQRYRAVTNAIPDIVWTAAPDGTILYANDQWFKFTGVAPDDNTKYWPELALHPDDYERCIKAWTHALQTGSDYEIEARNRRYDGEYRWFLTRAVAARDADGNITAWYGTTSDIHARKQAEQTNDFLDRATNLLNTSLDFDATLKTIADLAVPTLADWCAVHVLTGDGQIRRLGFAHRDPQVVERINARPSQYPLDASIKHLAPYVISTGLAELNNHVTDPLLQEAARDPAHLETLRRLGIKAFVSIPLQARGRTLGAVTLAMSDSGRTYSSSDLELAQELIRRAALAADNAWLYQESQAAQARLKLIAEAGSEVIDSLDYDTRLERLAQLVVPRFADWCSINLVREDGSISLATLAHADPHQEKLLREWVERYPISTDSPRGTANVIRTGKAEWVPDLSQDEFATSLPPEQMEYSRQLRVRSYMIIPLTARGRVFGAITFANSESARLFGFQDLLLGEEIARRAATALDNAALFRKEQAARSIAEQSAAQVTALQRVTSALATALTSEQVGDVILKTGLPALEAQGGVLGEISEDGESLYVVNWVGYPDDRILPWRHYSLSTLTPLSAAARGELIALESPEAAQEQYPGLRFGEQAYQSWMLVPLRIEERPLGGLLFSFREQRKFTESDREFANALAQQAAQALERAHLYAREQRARERAEENAKRIAALQRVTAALATALTPIEVAQAVLEQGVGSLGASSGALALLNKENQTIEMLSSFSYDSATLENWRAIPADSHVPIADAIRTGEILAFESLQDATARYPHVPFGTNGNRAWLVLPLQLQQQRLGGLWIGYNREHQFTEADRAFAQALARQCAQALERAQLYESEMVAREQAERAAKRSEWLTEASHLLSSSLDYETTFRQVANLAVPQIADWCSIYIKKEDGTAEPLIIWHKDPEMLEFLDEIRQYFTQEWDAPRGLPRVIREGVSEFYPDIPDSLLVQTAKNQVQLDILRRFGLSSGMTVPLKIHDRVLGAISFANAESRRHFTGDDLELAELLAGRAAVAIENAELYHAEQNARRSAEESARRISSLQTITSAFSNALTQNQVSEIVIAEGLTALGAQAGSVVLLAETGEMLNLSAHSGYSASVIEQFRSFPVTAATPLAEAARTKRPLFLESAAETVARFPHLEKQIAGGYQARACLPLLVKGQTVGAIGLSFTTQHTFSDNDRAFMSALAQQAAQALERARLYESELRARQEAERGAQRNEWLVKASEVLAHSLDYTETLRELAQLVTDELADWCMIDMAKGDGTAEQLVLTHRDPEKLKWARDYGAEIQQYFTPDWNAPMGLPKVLRTGKSEAYYDIPDELLRQVAKNEVQLSILRGIGYSSVLIVPLNVQEETLGAITMVNTDSRRHFTPDDLVLAELFAGRAAVAIENARLYNELQTLNAELEERVQERTYQLRQAYQELSHEVVERTRAQETTSALLRISNKLNSTLNVQESLDILIREAISLMQASVGFAGLRTSEGMRMLNYYENGGSVPIDFTWAPGKGMPGWVLEHGKPYLTNDAPNDPVMLHHLPFNQDVRHALCTPIIDAQNQVAGFFEVRDKTSDEPFTEADADFLRALSPIAAIALENARAYQKISEAESVVQNSYAQLRALAARLQTIREEERTDIARELHDELGQALTALKMDVAAVLARLPKRNKVLAERAQAMSQQIDATIKTVRRMSSQLRPGMLDDLGLGPSLEWYGQEFQGRTNVVVETRVPEEELNLTHTQATALYRIFQETLTNVARHADATHVLARLEVKDNLLTFEISDNGKGFDLGQVRGKRSLGLLGMRERAEMIQATLEIQGAVGKGTTILVRMPLQNQER